MLLQESLLNHTLVSVDDAQTTILCTAALRRMDESFLMTQVARDGFDSTAVDQAMAWLAIAVRAPCAARACVRGTLPSSAAFGIRGTLPEGVTSLPIVECFPLAPSCSLRTTRVWRRRFRGCGSLRTNSSTRGSCATCAPRRCFFSHF